MDSGSKDFVPPKPLIHTCHLRRYRHNSAGGGAAGAPAAGGNACGVRLRSPRPAFFSPSNCSVVLKMCAIIMFLMPVCFCSSPNLNFIRWSPPAGNSKCFHPPPARPQRPLRLACTTKSKCYALSARITPATRRSQNVILGRLLPTLPDFGVRHGALLAPGTAISILIPFRSLLRDLFGNLDNVCL